MVCLITARYNCKADLYNQTVTQSESGELHRNFTFVKTIECVVTSPGRDVEKFNTDYAVNKKLVLSCREPLSNRNMIKDIRLKDETPLYEDAFGVVGVDPVIDPFSRIVEYKVFLESEDDV